jgi:hypothetical protein
VTPTEHSAHRHSSFYDQSMPDLSKAEAIIGAAILEADALIRARLFEADIRIPHVVLAVDQEGTAYVLNNAGPEVLRDLATVILEIADNYSPLPAK